MPIAKLTTLVPPPAAAAPLNASEWLRVESDVGTQLPTDYKAFVDRYGLGRLSDFIVVFVPMSDNPNADLAVQVERQLGALRELRDAGEPCPYSFYPEPGGLLPFAATDNGDVLFWLTSGSPDNWSVVVNEARSPLYAAHQCNMVDFLTDLLTGKRHTAVLSRDFQLKMGFTSA